MSAGKQWDKKGAGKSPSVQRCDVTSGVNLKVMSMHPSDTLGFYQNIMFLF